MKKLLAGIYRFFKTQEGFIFLLGIIVFILGFLFVYPLNIPDKWQGFLFMIIAGIAGGKGVSIPVGLRYLPKWLVVVVASLHDMVAVFWFFPFIVLFRNRIIRGKLIENIVRDAETAVKKHKSWLKPLGVLGVGFFVWVPLTMTGPVIGSVLGLILGMSTLTIILTVVIAGILSALCWTYFLDFMLNWAKNVNQFFPGIAVILILILILIIRLQAMYKKGAQDEKKNIF